jgi:16S rRNA (cytosine967-C5)-methyltransferase
VPCSGLGILGKKADLRYNASLENIEELVKLQQEILSNACKYTKPNGYLIFSTCTINPKENIDNVKWILKNFPEYQLISLHDELPLELSKEIQLSRNDNAEDTDIDKKTLQLLPGINDCDGFYIAKLRRMV